MPVSSLLRRFAPVLACLLVAFSFLWASPAQAQGRRKVVQFTGIVASGDSLLGVPGATVYVPKAGCGTSTNAYGYFSLAVLTGDSIVIRSLGFRNETVIIPPDYQGQSYSIIAHLREDMTVLPEVRVFPYSTEKDFKRAFLALKLPTERGSAVAANLNSQLMQRIFNTLPMSPVANYRQTMEQQGYDYQRRMGMGQTPQANNPLLNPFSWLKLVQQVKSGEFKKKEGVDY